MSMAKQVARMRILPSMSTTPACTTRRCPAAFAALLLALLALIVLAVPPAGAADSPPPTSSMVSGPSDIGILTDPAQRERYHHLAGQLRCLVCQNQTLADSNAELAADLRLQVETMIVAGHSDDEIKRYLVDRYGNFVLYRPPVQENTWLLWFGPFGLLLLGVLVWWRAQRRARPAEATDLERARRLLDE